LEVIRLRIRKFGVFYSIARQVIFRASTIAMEYRQTSVRCFKITSIKKWAYNSARKSKVI